MSRRTPEEQQTRSSELRAFICVSSSLDTHRLNTCDPGALNQSRGSSDACISGIFPVMYDRTILENLVQKNQNIEKIIFKVVQIKFLAMHITNQ